jgi:hypothetical protein
MTFGIERASKGPDAGPLIRGCLQSRSRPTRASVTHCLRPPSPKPSPVLRLFDYPRSTSTYGAQSGKTRKSAVDRPEPTLVTALLGSRRSRHSVTASTQQARLRVVYRIFISVQGLAVCLIHCVQVGPRGQWPNPIRRRLACISRRPCTPCCGRYDRWFSLGVSLITSGK